MGEHLREWHDGQGVVRSEMVMPICCSSKQYEAQEGSESTAGGVEGCDVNKAPESVGIGGQVDV